MYGTAQQQAQYGSINKPAPVDEPRDPREDGSLCAKLQVAEEIIRSLRVRITRLADTIQGSSQSKEPSTVGEVHMNLLRFPDEIIEDGKASHSALNRIEGALGV